ncbi:MAG: tetratricopeptide repeat protein [Bacteroidota bacterium]
MKALKHYFDGRQLFDDNKREKGIAEVEQAVQLDPNFAEAYKMLGIQQYRNQQSEQGEKSLGKAISLSNTIGLPERQKFDMRYYYYAKNDQAKKTLNLLKMWNQLYPNDYIPYYRLYSIYSNRKEYKVAEEFVIKAIDNGHIARSLPRMATLCALQGRYEEALEYLQRFEQEYPHKAKINTSMGRLYQRMGKLDKALEYFEAIQLLQPNDPYAIGNVAYVQTNLGNIDEAEKLYLEALSKAKLPQDSSSVTQWMLYFYGTIGQLENYEKYLWMTINTRSTFRPPAEAYSILAWYDHIIFYVQHGEQKRYRRFLDDYNNRFTRGNDNMACVNKLTFAMATLNLEESKLYGDQCIDFFGEVAGKHYVYLFDALVADMEKDYPEMIAKFEAFIDATGSKEQFWASQLARAHRQNGDFQKAYDIIKQSLMLSPNSPELCYEMARICLAMEKNEEAVKYLQTANKIWRKADPRFKPAQEVREKLAELAG